MHFWKILAIALALAAPFAPAQAATVAAKYKVELFIEDNQGPKGDGIADAEGILTVFKFDDILTDTAFDFALSIIFDGVTYDSYTPSSFDFFDTTTGFGDNYLTTTLTSDGVPKEPATTTALSIGPTAFRWALSDCTVTANDTTICTQRPRPRGDYVITQLPVAPIPLPATVLLLPAALGALCLLRRRAWAQKAVGEAQRDGRLRPLGSRDGRS